MVAARVVDTGGVVMETNFFIASVAVVVSGTVVIAASVIIIGATDEDAEGMFVEDKVVVAIFSVMSVVFDDAASVVDTDATVSLFRGDIVEANVFVA